MARCYSIDRAMLWLAAALLAGCGLLPEQPDETADWSAQRFYTEAKDELNTGNYDRAVELFEKLQARYPFGRYAQQAQLEIIYAYYKDSEPDSAIAAADRFIKTNPRHPFVDYAYYLKGLANFDRDVTVVNRLVPNDPTKTDTSAAQQSFDDFSELVRRFPESRYAEDARSRLLFLHDNLAAYEVNVADFYMRRGAYVAAVNRARYVLENYARTHSVDDALAIMTRGYVRLGLRDLAADSLRVLALNYPDSPHVPPLTALVEGRERRGLLSAFGGSS